MRFSSLLFLSYAPNLIAYIIDFYARLFVVSLLLVFFPNIKHIYIIYTFIKYLLLFEAWKTQANNNSQSIRTFPILDGTIIYYSTRVDWKLNLCRNDCCNK